MITHVPKHKRAKARFTLEQATTAQRGLYGGWMVKATPRPLKPAGKRPGTPCTGGWVGPRAGLYGYRKSRPLREIAKNVPINTKLVQTHDGRACHAHAHCAPLQTGCETTLQTTDTQAWINNNNNNNNNNSGPVLTILDVTYRLTLLSRWQYISIW